MQNFLTQIWTYLLHHTGSTRKDIVLCVQTQSRKKSVALTKEKDRSRFTVMSFPFHTNY